eukprot:6209604-Pleurochrysis_carterae.AAC.2
MASALDRLAFWTPEMLDGSSTSAPGSCLTIRSGSATSACVPAHSSVSELCSTAGWPGSSTSGTSCKSVEALAVPARTVLRSALPSSMTSPPSSSAPLAASPPCATRGLFSWRAGSAAPLVEPEHDCCSVSSARLYSGPWEHKTSRTSTASYSDEQASSTSIPSQLRAFLSGSHSTPRPAVSR